VGGALHPTNQEAANNTRKMETFRAMSHLAII